MINFLSTSRPLAATDIDAVEKRFDFKFPADLRNHYLRFNGGYPEKDRFVDDKGTCIVQEFLPIKESAVPTLSTFERSVQTVKINQALVPEFLVQFAVDPFGNYYCFSTRETDAGAIYFVRMDGDSRRAAEYLCGSFGEFLGRLQAK